MYNTVCVCPEHDEVDGLAPHVALFGSWRGEDWETPLTIAEARALAQALLAAAYTAETRCDHGGRRHPLNCKSTEPRRSPRRRAGVPSCVP